MREKTEKGQKIGPIVQSTVLGVIGADMALERQAYYLGKGKEDVSLGGALVLKTKQFGLLIIVSRRSMTDCIVLLYILYKNV